MFLFIYILVIVIEDDKFLLRFELSYLTYALFLSCGLEELHNIPLTITIIFETIISISHIMKYIGWIILI